MDKGYETPTVKTLKADEIVELLGPVSCGSGGAYDLLPGDTGYGSASQGSSGYSSLGD
jgi:hypothetical protein